MKRFSIFVAITVGFMMCGINPGHSGAGTMDLISTLVDSLGITKDQAKGGTGALFRDAKEKLSPGDFQKVSDAVPGMEGYLAAAPAGKSGGGLSGSLGSSLSSLAGGGGKAGALLDLNSAFSSLGMDSGTLGKFIPIVLDFVQAKGGESVMNLLKGLWT